ncbi:AraC family transcriptional regulator [Ulvibacter sp. MAR_2010_11]|uniref:AraC family transcriptional regulator n=1 Tax=Ulvibacter sp. MAR_2010_11 TaxID=1250229 RepID=UPI000C2C5A8F|nr:helix-turn-helix domain-containing protein [Ulvibacter sp. MAR_2010_11]PKA82343.1 AraC family transcriptional regulator [Ulvibacter sp. MAR_2010_11]
MEPSLDTWTSIFLLAVAMGLFLFVILMTSGIRKNYPIAFLILAFSLILFQYVLYWTHYDQRYPFLIQFPPVCYYATGPLLYLYFLNLYKHTIPKWFALHFIPSMVLMIPTVILWLKYAGITTMSIPMQPLVNAYWLIVAHMVGYAILILLLIAKHKELTSEFGKVRHKWAKVLITLYMLFILAYVSYYVLVNFSFFNSQWDYMISMMMSISIYTIGYFIMKQPKIFDGELFAHVFLPIKNKDESFEASLLNEFFENLTQYMAKQKPYTDNELRLVHLADQVGYSTHLLSKVINKKSGKNFNSFVNEYRLREAEQLLRSQSDEYIKNIYFDVGFNNKATFYKAFKNKYSCTPSEYKERLADE